MGRANGLEYIIQAAKSLKDAGDDTICFVFMGDGATLPMLKEMGYKEQNITIAYRHPYDANDIVKLLKIED